MTQSIGGFFGGGSKGISFDCAPPKTVTGTIIAVHPPEQILDMATNAPAISKRTGRPRMQIRIELQTDERSAEIEFDDGSRTLYVKSWMTGAIGDALRKAGAKEPEIGGKLTVTFTHEDPAVPNNIKRYSAIYEPPTSATANHFAGNGLSAPGQAASSNGPVKPTAISDDAWSSMDESTRRAVATTMAGADKPPF